MIALKIAFLASSSPEAEEAMQSLAARYPHVEPEQADIIIALGGDGFMLQTQHRFMGQNKPVYGMNRGTVGFLLNLFDEGSLEDRLAKAERVTVRPLRMKTQTRDGAETSSLAINEVSLLRQTRQAAKLRVWVDGRVRLEELICDGVMIATPVGSTAYNMSAHGPILPIGSQVLALTPVSAFRPRRWRGAILPCRANVRFEVLEQSKRPVSAVADATEIRDVTSVEVFEDVAASLTFLFDPGRGLDERVLNEQFTV